MDFGLARREAGEVTMTVEGRVLGTPAYMSPEQAKGQHTRRIGVADVYSLGVILFEMLTGERPFRGNVRMLVSQVINDEPPSPRKLNGSVPRDLETICLKCLEKEPSRRFETARDVAEDLRRFLSGDAIKARPAGRLERACRWSRAHRALVAATSTIMLALLLGLGGTSIGLHKVRIERDRAVAAEKTASDQTEITSKTAASLEQALQAIVSAMGANEAEYELVPPQSVPEILDAVMKWMDSADTLDSRLEIQIRWKLGIAYRAHTQLTASYLNFARVKQLLEHLAEEDSPTTHHASTLPVTHMVHRPRSLADDLVLVLHFLSNTTPDPLLKEKYAARVTATVRTLSATNRHVLLFARSSRLIRLVAFPR